MLFADNQVALLVQAEARAVALSSVLIVSLDDLSFHGNECDVQVASGGVATNLLALAVWARVTDNRLTEGLPNALFSGVTAGILNATAHNQTFHCLVIRGWPGFVVSQPNTELVEVLGKGFCERFNEILSDFGGSLATEGG